MATGDQTDFLGRLKAVLPDQWFPDVTPILDGLMTGAANALAFAYALRAYVKLQARLLTGSGITLDLFSADYFGSGLQRRTNESDAAYTARIQRELFREKGTRAGLIQALVDLTGQTPQVFEPAYTLDTGGYGSSGMTVGTGLGYGAAGGYGSRLLPFQFFVTAFLPANGGIANVAGYGGNGFFGMPGGYGAGAIEYATPSMIEAEVTDADIYAAIEDVRPIATIAWTRIEPAP